MVLERPAGLRFDLGGQPPSVVDPRIRKRRLQPSLAKRRHPRLTNAPRGKHAGIAGAENFLHLQALGDLAGDLARGATERRQGVFTGVEPALGGDTPYGLGHLLDRDGDKSLRGDLGARRAHGLCQHLQPCACGGRVERRIAVSAKHRWEEPWVQASQHQVRVRDRRRAAAAVAGRARVRAGAGRAGSGPHAVKGEDRAAARRDSFHIQRRRTKSGARHARGIAAFQHPRKTADIRRCAAHVEPQHGGGPGRLRRPCDAHHAAGGTRHHRVPPSERLGANKSARRGHEKERRAANSISDPPDVGLQHRGQIGVCDRRFGARNEFRKR